jgi:hypothetical protein
MNIYATQSLMAFKMFLYVVQMLSRRDVYEYLM